ncbi:hypothetical protein D3C81_1891730 [compost metagenome]
MHDEVELAPLLFKCFKNSINACTVSDIAMSSDESVQFFSQWLDALLQRITLISECEFRTSFTSSLGNTPGDGTVVGYAQNQSALALQQT